MNAMRSDETGSAMEYAGRGPLGWQAIDPANLDEEVARHEAVNQRVLADILLLEHGDRDDGSEPVKETDAERLERKVDLLIDLVGRLNASLNDVPADTDFRLTPQHLSWWSDHVPPYGIAVRVSLHLNPAHPGPVVLVGRTEECAPASANLRLHHPGAGPLEALERFIFVNHRRRIAALRTR